MSSHTGCHLGRSGLAPLALSLLFWCVSGAGAHAQDAAPESYPDWDAVDAVEVIEVVTQDEDGDTRQTKVWFVRVDGRPYLRTSGSRWLANLRRAADLELIISGERYQARADLAEGDEILAKVDEASRVKYGWQERMIHVFRMRRPEILKLSPRTR